jgi:hypothetical protein
MNKQERDYVHPHIGKLIRAVFDTSGMTITALAKKIKTTRQNVYGIFERDSIDTFLLVKISKELKHDFFIYFRAGMKDGKQVMITLPARQADKLINVLSSL